MLRQYLFHYLFFERYICNLIVTNKVQTIVNGSTIVAKLDVQLIMIKQ